MFLKKLLYLTFLVCWHALRLLKYFVLYTFVWIKKRLKKIVKFVFSKFKKITKLRDLHVSLNFSFLLYLYYLLFLTLTWMPLKKINFYKNLFLVFFKKQIHNFRQLIFFSIFCLFFICIFLILFYNNVIYYKFFYKLFFIYCFFFFIFSTFLHLTKQYQYNKYTSQIQRFWKRTYLIFWIIELGLFFIFLYLLMIHFYESPYFLDWKIIQSIIFEPIVNYIFYLFLIILLLLAYVLFFFIKNNLHNCISVVLYLIMLLIFIFFFYEFLKFFYILNFYSDTELQLIFQANTILTTTTVSEIENINKTRTLIFYVHLFNLLKFWHIVFIVFSFVYFLLHFFYYNYASIDLWSTNNQNFLFLLLFHLLANWIIIKNSLIIVGQNVYFWFFLTTNKCISMYSLFLELFLC